MITKTALIVLLGAALVVAGPVSKTSSQKKTALTTTKVIDEVLDRSIEEAWAKLEKKFEHAVDEVSKTLADIKARGEKIVDVNFEAIKKKGILLLEMAKETYKEIVVQGKEVAGEFQIILKSATELLVELKKTGIEASGDVKELIDETIATIKENLRQAEISKKKKN